MTQAERDAAIDAVLRDLVAAEDSGLPPDRGAVPGFPGALPDPAGRQPQRPGARPRRLPRPAGRGPGRGRHRHGGEPGLAARDRAGARSCRRTCRASSCCWSRRRWPAPPARPTPPSPAPTAPSRSAAPGACLSYMEQRNFIVCRTAGRGGHRIVALPDLGLRDRARRPECAGGGTGEDRGAIREAARGPATRSRPPCEADGTATIAKCNRGPEEATGLRRCPRRLAGRADLPRSRPARHARGGDGCARRGSPLTGGLAASVAHGLLSAALPFPKLGTRLPSAVAFSGNPRRRARAGGLKQDVAVLLGIGRLALELGFLRIERRRPGLGRGRPGRFGGPAAAGIGRRVLGRQNRVAGTGAARAGRARPGCGRPCRFCR